MLFFFGNASESNLSPAMPAIFIALSLVFYGRVLTHNQKRYPQVLVLPDLLVFGLTKQMAGLKSHRVLTPSVPRSRLIPASGEGQWMS